MVASAALNVTSCNCLHPFVLLFSTTNIAYARLIGVNFVHGVLFKLCSGPSPFHLALKLNVIQRAWKANRDEVPRGSCAADLDVLDERCVGYGDERVVLVDVRVLWGLLSMKRPKNARGEWNDSEFDAFCLDSDSRGFRGAPARRS